MSAVTAAATMLLLIINPTINAKSTKIKKLIKRRKSMYPPILRLM